MNRFFASAFGMVITCSFLLLASACTPSATTAVTTAAVNLATVAGQNNTTVEKLVSNGALFCANNATQIQSAQNLAGVVSIGLNMAADMSVPGTAAVASVLNQTSQAVSTVCAALGKVPVAVPASLAPSVPVVAAPASAPVLPAASAT